MDQSIVAQYITELVLGVVALATGIFRYREIIQFFWPAIKWTVKPIAGFWRWIRMPYEVSKQQVQDGKKIQDIENAVAELTKFVKEKLMPNGGSSPVDALKRIEARQIIDGQMQKAYLQDTNLGHFKCDMKGKNEWVNRSYARFIGCGTAELLGFGWKKFIKSQELERYNEVWQQAFQDNCEFEDLVHFTDVHGQTIQLRISVTLLTDEKTGPI